MKILITLGNYIKNHISHTIVIIVLIALFAYFINPFDGATFSQKRTETKNTISLFYQLLTEDETRPIESNELPDLGDLELQTLAGSITLFRDVRAGNWEFIGADRHVMAETMKRVINHPGNKDKQFIDTFPGEDTGPGTWVYEWSETAQEYYNLAFKAEEKGDFNIARKSYYLAAIYFDIAKFPHLGYPEEEKAHSQATNSYEKAGRYFEVPLEKIVIPFEGGDIVGYLHLPERSVHEKVPAVIWSGGLDYFKEWLYPNVQELNRQGIAAITMDTAGLSDNDEWLLTPGNASKIVTQMINKVSRHPRIDPDRIGVAGTSFGGNIAVRLAITDTRIKAAVNHGGPIHRMWAVHPRIMGIIKEMVRHTYSDRTGADVKDVFDMTMKGKAFDLVAAGLVGQNRYTTDTPILSVNGGKDLFAPVSDMALVTDASSSGEYWVMGVNEGHCTHAYEPVMIPQIAAWFASKLN